jgi:hypothetical protein
MLNGPGENFTRFRTALLLVAGHAGWSACARTLYSWRRPSLAAYANHTQYFFASFGERDCKLVTTYTCKYSAIAQAASGFRTFTSPLQI